MKKFFYGLLAAMFLIVSCTTDDFGQEQREGMVDFTISTSIPQGSLSTRLSHNGGATNVNPANFDLRYIMEVWTTGATPQLAYRGYRIVTNNFATTGVTFNVRLLAQEYNFVFWADFVPVGTTTDHFYVTTNGLTNIVMSAVPYAISTDARDAYFAAVPVDLRTTGQLGNVTLYRPFGKFRLIATDVPSGTLQTVDVASATINYALSGTTTMVPNTFNALTGETGTPVLLNGAFTAATSIENAVVGGVTHNNAIVLAFDYIFAPQTGTTVSFSATALNAAGQDVAQRDLPNIPIERNQLTTIIGNFFTNAAVMNIIVSDPFENEEIIHTDLFDARANLQNFIDRVWNAVWVNDVNFDALVEVPGAIGFRGIGCNSIWVRDGANQPVNVLGYGLVNALAAVTDFPTDRTVDPALTPDIATIEAAKADIIGFLVDIIDHLSAIRFSINDAWEVNRFAPASWTSVFHAGREAIQSTVNESTGLFNRPVGHEQTNFANTQGRSVSVPNPTNSDIWELQADIYVSSAMLAGTTPFMVSVWGTTNHGLPGGAYPIISASNTAGDRITSIAPEWQFWTASGWVSGPALTTAGWHTVTMKSDGSGTISYYINGIATGISIAGTYTNLTALILMNYNFTTVLAGDGSIAFEYPGFEMNAFFANMRATIR